MRDLCLYLARCFCLRKSEALRSMKKGRNDYYLQQGQKKLEKDLNIVNYFDLLKGFRLMQQVLFTEQQLVLLKFQQANVVNIRESETSSSSCSSSSSRRELVASKKGIKEGLKKFMNV